MKAFWFNTYAGLRAQKWVVLHDEQPIVTERDPTGIELTVYDYEELADQGWLEGVEDWEYFQFSDFLETVDEHAYFEFPLWKEADSAELNASFVARFYLRISISYKGIHPRFGHQRDDNWPGQPPNTSKDYQWFDQYEVLHHGQLLQKLLLYASQQGGMMGQQETDMLQINPPLKHE
jgi:hypothetical protein